MSYHTYEDIHTGISTEYCTVQYVKLLNHTDKYKTPTKFPIISKQRFNLAQLRLYSLMHSLALSTSSPIRCRVSSLRTNCSRASIKASSALKYARRAESSLAPAFAVPRGRQIGGTRCAPPPCGCWGWCCPPNIMFAANWGAAAAAAAADSAVKAPRAPVRLRRHRTSLKENDECSRNKLNQQQCMNNMLLKERNALLDLCTALPSKKKTVPAVGACGIKSSQAPRIRAHKELPKPSNTPKERTIASFPRVWLPARTSKVRQCASI